MRSIAACLSLLALLSPLLAGCQKQPEAKSAGPGVAGQPASPPEPNRKLWHTEKAKVFAAVGRCSITPAEAIRQLEQRRAELAPSVKQGKPIGFSPDNVRKIARKAGCPSA